MSLLNHKNAARKYIKCGIITVSDSRTMETDKSGQLMIKLLKENGHLIEDYHIVKDNQSEIQEKIFYMSNIKKIQSILINGGTGIAKKDVTIEAVSSLFEKEITGFGELFRYLSYTEDIGSSSMLSRATAGVYNDKVIFVTPGSSGAVKLAMNKLILPELGHIVHEIEKDICY